MERPTQREKVLRMLESGNWVSVRDFLLAGVSRFGARIFEIRRAGYEIESREEHKGRSRYVSYRLVPKGQQNLFAKQES